MTFAEHKEQTANDCEQIAVILNDLAKDAREGNLKKVEEFWMEGGTAEGDAKIFSTREIFILRYLLREEKVNGKTDTQNPSSPPELRLDGGKEEL